MKEKKKERMELKDFARGLYVWDVNMPGKVKVYDREYFIKTVMVRATDRDAYYIIKFRYLKDGVEDRIDCINEFRINGKTLKSFLEKNIINIRRKK